MSVSPVSAAYRASLAELRRVGGRSVAFPAISTGIYGYPPDRATAVAVRAVRADLAAQGDDLDVTFCCFDQATLALYDKELATVKGYYKKAKPYLEHLRELTPDEPKRWASALQMVYSSLQMKEQAKEMDDLLDAANKAGN